MPRLIIDERLVEVEEGTTLLHAAHKLDLEIPTLCFLEGYRPSSSCMLCVVEDLETRKTLPACSALAKDGMRIQTRSPELDRLRKEALELLLSDHRGDCRAPCARACPAHLDIPEMLRRLAERDLAGAVDICLERIPLPATLGIVCPAPCEKVCRRAAHDGALAIRRLKHFVGGARLLQDDGIELGSPRSGDLGEDIPQSKAPDGGSARKRVAVIGAGPAGLSASYYLTRRGFQCILYEREDVPGGGLLAAPGVPRGVLKAEIRRILSLGVQLETGRVLGRNLAFGELTHEFDAVVLATGIPDQGILRVLKARGFPSDGGGGPGAAHRPFAGGAPIFACGSLLKPSRMAVRAVAQGRTAALGVLRCLAGLSGSSGNAAEDDDGIFDFPFGKLQPGDMDEFLRGASRASPVVAVEGTAVLTAGDAEGEAARCLQCDCGASRTCLLRKYAEEYGAGARRYPDGERREFQRMLQHPSLIYEPGKCIQCGRCIWIADKAGEELGLSFQKRGFQVRVGVPFGEDLSEGLKKAAQACAEACPTGALVLKRARPITRDGFHGTEIIKR